MCNCIVCGKPTLIQIYSQTGKTLVAQYCEAHTFFGLKEISKPYHIIRCLR